MADPIASIYNYLGNEAQNTRANFSAVQQSLVQARTMQLREQEQMFNQSLDLRKLDILEKQNVFDNMVAQKKLGMTERDMGWQDKLSAAKLASIESLTGLRDAQALKAEAGSAAAHNIPYPVNGTPEEIIKWDQQVNQAGGFIEQSWVNPTGSREVDGAYVPDPSDPLDVETAAAYAEQGGAVASSSDLPSDSGSAASPALFGSAGEAAGGLGGMRPFPPIKLTPQQSAVGSIAAATVEQITPKDEFEQFFQAANRGIAATLTNPNINEGARSKIVSQMQIGLMRGAMKYADTNPKAKAFLNDVAPERDRVKAAAARGDEQIAQSIIRANEARLGYFNPILADAEAEGYAEYAKLQTIEDQAKVKKAIRDELSDLTKDIASLKTATLDVPPYMTARLAQLQQEAYGNPVKEVEKKNLLDSLFKQ